MQKIVGILAAVRIPAAQRSLKQQIVVSTLLSTLAFFFTSFLRLCSTVIITRLLAPEVFGVFAVLMMFAFVLTMFSDFGIRSLILTREGDLDDEFLWACWTVQLIRGVGLSFLIVLIGGGVALVQNMGVLPHESSFSAPVLPLAIAALSIGFLLQGSESPNKYVYERAMRFGRVTIADLIQAVLSFVIVMSLAYYFRSIWALVLATVVNSFTQVFLSLALFDGPKMRLSKNRTYIRTIFERGRWIVTHSALTAFVSIADRLVLGIYMPATEFGFYHIAKQLIEMPASFLNTIHAKVGLQVFTELQKGDDRASFLTRYYGYRRFFDILAMLGCGLLFTLAPLIVHILYDDRYAGVAQIVQILSLGLPLTGFVILREAFSAQRQFRIMSFLSVVQVVTIWVGLIVAVVIFHSIALALGVLALHRLPEIVVLLYLSHRKGWVNLWKEIRFFPVILVGVAIGYAVTALSQLAGL